MKKVLLFFILFPLIFFSFFNSVKAENEPFCEVIKISSPTGNRTMEEILNDWETNGWPDYVGYAYLGALNTGKSTFTNTKFLFCLLALYYLLFVSFQ